MPKMRVKATIANFDSETFPNAEKMLARAFCDCATMFVQGVYANGALDHLSCNWQTDKKLLCIAGDTSSWSNLSYDADVSKIIFDMPYTNNVWTDQTISNGVETINGLPDVTSTLIKNNTNLYVLTQPGSSDEDRSSDRFYLSCTPINNVELSPFIGTLENKDAKIKPVVISKDNQLLTLSTTINDTMPSLMDYDLRTDKFSIRVTDGMMYNELEYRMWVIPYYEKSSGNKWEVTEETSASNIASNLMFSLGDDGITIDDKKSLVMYLCSNEESESPYSTSQKFLQARGTYFSNDEYFWLPPKIIMPIYSDSGEGTEIMGFLYAVLYMYDSPYSMSESAMLDKLYYYTDEPDPEPTPVDILRLHLHTATVE